MHPGFPEPLPMKWQQGGQSVAGQERTLLVNRDCSADSNNGSAGSGQAGMSSTGSRLDDGAAAGGDGAADVPSAAADAQTRGTAAGFGSPVWQDGQLLPIGAGAPHINQAAGNRASAEDSGLGEAAVEDGFNDSTAFTPPAAKRPGFSTHSEDRLEPAVSGGSASGSNDGSSCYGSAVSLASTNWADFDEAAIGEHSGAAAPVVLVSPAADSFVADFPPLSPQRQPPVTIGAAGDGSSPADSPYKHEPAGSPSPTPPSMPRTVVSALKRRLTWHGRSTDITEKLLPGCAIARLTPNFGH